MKIAANAVIISSQRTFEKAEYTKTSISNVDLNGAKDSGLIMDETTGQITQGDTVSLGETGDNDTIRKNIKDISQKLEDQRLEQLKQKLCPQQTNLDRLDEDSEINLIEKMLEKIFTDEEGNPKFRFHHDSTSVAQSSSMHTFSFSFAPGMGMGVRASSANEMYFSQESYISESEAVSFGATGVALTADGREISFDINLNMSRSFTQATSLAGVFRTEQSLVDPLVINLDTDAASISAQTFTFDLDANGTSENIAKLAQGSGYLALDKNGDGKINDGSELFGARTGDGFAELAQYDDDKNGWIDENDSVFGKLKVWVQSGNESLTDIKKAGVGAIFLGSTDTRFSLTESTAENAGAVIRSSGLYLKENGEAGTVQHLDLVI